MFAALAAAGLLAAPAMAQPAPKALAAVLAGRDAYNAGRIAEAERHYNQAVQLLQAGPRQEFGYLVYPLVGLTSIDLDAGRYAEALRTSEQALKHATEMFGPRSEEALMAMNPMGVALDGLADPRAHGVWQQAVGVADGLRNPNDPEARLSPRFNYAASLMAEGDLAGAEEAGRRVLRDRLALYGDRPEGRFFVAASRLGLAQTLSRRSNVLEAESLLRTALGDVKRARERGEVLRDDDLTIASLVGLSDILIEMGRLRDAESLLADAASLLNGRRYSFGATNNLALLKYRTGSVQEAVPMFRKVYQQRLEAAWMNAPGKRKLRVEDAGFAASGLANPDLLLSAANLAQALFGAGQREEAARLQGGVVSAHEVLSEADGLGASEARSVLGEMRAGMGASDGIAMLRRAYRALDDRPEFADLRVRAGYRLGSALLKSGQAKEAFPLLDAYGRVVVRQSRQRGLPTHDARLLLDASNAVFEDVMEAAWAAAR